MILLVLFAFLAGIVTILSPCILPILPIVLSGSLGGGKRRPLGVVTGFVLSFAFFTLSLSTIVKATGISADSLRNVSVVTVILFGLSLLLPKFQYLIEQLFTKLARFTPKQQDNSNFTSGMLLGISLGLVWTPCVGPILASVISLALTGSVSGAAVFITLAYAIGTAIPMLAITYGGRQLLQKAPWLVSHTAHIQKAFGILMILTALGIFFKIDRKFQTFILEKFPQYGVGLTSFEDNEFIQQEIKKFQPTPIDEIKKGKPMFQLLNEDLGEAPELIAGGQWFNSPPLTLQSLRGQVVLIDFWTYTCINCIRTLPYLKAWHEKYKDKGLVIIGVHTPEFEFEKNAQNVHKAISDFDLQYPIMQDNNYATWKAYNNRYWPAKYFIDKKGRIRWTHFGEGKYDESENIIQQLLAETGASIENVQINNPQYRIDPTTPELYLGYARIEYLDSPEKIAPDTPTQYSLSQSSLYKIPLHGFAFEGTWTVGKERAMPHANAALVLHFESKEVFLVMRPKKKSGRVRVLLDGELVRAFAGIDVMKGIVEVKDERLYKLIKLPHSTPHLLRLEFLDDHLELYAFTFG